MTANDLVLDRPAAVGGRRPRLPQFRRFRPPLAVGYQQELHGIVRMALASSNGDVERVLRTAVESSEQRSLQLRDSGLQSRDLLPTIRFEATLRVLRDLLIQGWSIREDDEGILLDAPGRGKERVKDPEVAKQDIRRSFAFAREAQLRQEPTLQFIARMEARGVERLFADGGELADRLTTRGAAGIQPELQLIERGARDEGTGLLLQDIWRYARHYWSIPYQSTPGRNMFYLVRDAAHEARPLIGIAALGNPVLGLIQRDHFFGWTARGLHRRLPAMPDEEQSALATRLYRSLEEGLEEVYRGDLQYEVSRDRWRVSVGALESVEARSAAERLEGLSEGLAKSAADQAIREAHKAVEAGHAADVDWERIAKTPLFRRKRAATLADLVRALGTLTDLGFSRKEGSLQVALATEAGTRALETALRRIKQAVIAGSVMELITCGAVPPYRDILAGKLVAMLMLSGQVVDDFKRRYTGRVSLIASAIAGRPVARRARLAAITTSSLYAIGSSQYNRIRLEQPAGSLAYRRIGKTESFGTVHFAGDTVEHLSQVARLSQFRREAINNMFGEGTSPKLRLVRGGLDALGLDAETFLRHHSPRLLYAAPLCSNMDQIAFGLASEPAYLLPPGGNGTAVVIEHWRDRWLSTRAQRPEILERLRGQAFVSFRLGAELDRLSQDHQASRRPTTIEVAGHASGGTIATSNAGTFVERLYRSSKSYADRLSREELDRIHIDLGVDEYLAERAKGRWEIVVTGNPGDGKTHLIERLRPRLEAAGARVITDANAESDADILKAWMASRKKHTPFVLAINEWPLFVLRRLAEKHRFTGVDEALRQVGSGRYFLETQRPAAPKENIAVIDLSLRTLLVPGVIDQVIDRLTQPEFYAGLSSADPAVSNRTALCLPQVRERLVRLLQFVSSRANHVTMRQLVGFVAFLLTGSLSVSERLRSGQDGCSFSYSNLAFEGGDGSLFHLVRSVFDPAAFAHPRWDEALWLGEGSDAAWLRSRPAGPLTFPEGERTRAFRLMKRQFYFEHEHGDELLRLAPADEAEFRAVLSAPDEAGPSLIRKLVLALNRFFEPDCPDVDRDTLHLWQSHRFDVRPPATFVVQHSLPYQYLRIERVRFAPWVERWLPEEQRVRRSFALVASAPDGRDIAMLEIDRELYLTLIESQRGLGRSSWSRTATRRVTRFVDQIGRGAGKPLPVEDVRIRNVDSDLEERFSISRRPARFQL